PTIVAGDFNAHSDEWGCGPWQRDPRGKAVADWAAGLGLVLMNMGSTSTYVRPNGGGESVIDLTWASPSAARGFRRWVVEKERESLPDHRYVTWTLRLHTPHR
ncbi:hypothetical protein EAI_07675, partial [Harpegnathos saltator]